MTHPVRSDTELLSIFVDGVLSGALSSQDLGRIEPAKLAGCWRWAIRAVGRGPADPNMVRAIEALVGLDPEFPSGPFLLGMALKKVGRLEEAYRAFANQARRSTGAHAEAKAMLTLLVGELERGSSTGRTAQA